RFLRSGKNEIHVMVENDGTAPNPAGLLGALEVQYAYGAPVRLVTDASWTGPDAGVKELGTWTMGPWGLSSGSLPQPDLYPSYERLAGILRSNLATPPDLEAGEALRYAHRKIGKLDAYFIANRSDRPFEDFATFRVHGAEPEWWDPTTGKTRPLPHYYDDRKTTRIPMRLEGLQSGFVIFRPNEKARPASGENFPRLEPMATLEGPWSVAFDPRFGGPASITFPGLADWKDHENEAIRHYSGKAVYTQTFDASSLPSGTAALSLGVVKNLASVRLNGRDLGTVWCAPWQVEIPAGVLKERDNRIEITVANLWANRLIGDAGKPESERVTSTTWSPYNS
ncbi:hypothetical protein EON79_23915, partial [bacterium]